MVPKRSGTFSAKTVHKEYGTIWLKGRCWNSQKVIVQFSVLRVHSPEVDSEERSWKTVDAQCSRLGNDWDYFSHNCLCLYGAIAEICEEYETLHDPTGQPVVAGQSSSLVMCYHNKTSSRPRRRLRGRYRLGHWPVVLLRTETARCRVRPT